MYIHIIVIYIYICIDSCSATSKLVKSQQFHLVVTSGVSLETLCVFFNVHQVAAFYRVTCLLEHKHSKKRGMSRVKRPMLRLSEIVTT